jgi:FAD/FMN-containing dehydrogenase
MRKPAGFAGVEGIEEPDHGLRSTAFDGVLRVDPSALGVAAEDFGHLMYHEPLAVLEPGSVEDIVRAVRFAREHNLKIVPRGAGHNTYGRSLGQGGIIIRMSELPGEPRVSDDRVEVNAGLTWAQLLCATVARGLRPPVLTSNLSLSVGGTLSFGGVDGASYRYGAQVDHVLELRVVTGEGKLEKCSPTQLPELFEAILAGQGQCAIIVSATIPLIPAPTHVLFSQLLYPHLPSMLEDLRMLVNEGRFDRVSAYALPRQGGGWINYIQAALYLSGPSEADPEGLLGGLRHIRGFERVSVLDYLFYSMRGVRYNDRLETDGRLGRYHPWFDAFLPDSALDQFAGEVLASLEASANQPDFPVEFYGVYPRLCRRPLLRLPDEELVFLTNVLTSFSNPDDAQSRLRTNRDLLERVQGLGGKVYPVNAVPVRIAEWPEHYGPAWEQFAAAKQRFDPESVLTPGPRIFHEDVIDG